MAQVSGSTSGDNKADESSVAVDVVAAPPTPNPMRLHIGGETPKDGWKILNIQPGEHVDFVGDIRNLSGFADGSCSEIYCSHVLEHIGQKDFLSVLRELHRMLCPEGRLYISVPDLDILCRLFISPQLDGLQRYHVMRIIFGGQEDRFDFHAIGLTLEFLVEFLAAAKFDTFEQVKAFDLFDDCSVLSYAGTPVSLNVIAVK